MRSIFSSPLQLAVVGTLHRLRAASLREIATDLCHEDTDRVRVTLGRLCSAGIVAVHGSSDGVDLWGLTEEGEARRDELIAALSGTEDSAPRERSAVGAGPAGSAPQR